MLKIKDNNGVEVGQLTVIGKYFRRQDETLAEFTQQCKKLSEKDKEELAIGAAKELSFTVEQA